MATPHASGVAALIAQSDVKFRGRALWERLVELAGRSRIRRAMSARGCCWRPTWWRCKRRPVVQVFGFGRA